MSTKLKVTVAVSASSISFDKPFDYLVPKHLADKVQAGKRILVPFGRGNRKRVALILSVGYADESTVSKLKYIMSVEDDEAVLNQEMLELMEWLRDTTFCTYYDAVKTMLPSGMNINIKEHYQLVLKDDLSQLTEREINVYNQFKEADNADLQAENLKAAGQGLLIESLVQKRFLKYRLDGKQAISDNTVKIAVITEEYSNNPDDFKLTVKQKALTKVILENENISVKEACYLCGVGTSVEKKLVEKGVIIESDQEVLRTVELGDNNTRNIENVILTDEQQKVFDKVYGKMNENKAHCFLLHGVTGSGKTSVFEKLIGRCINDGKQAILLIPEISLTPQMVSKFRELYGETVAVIHSGLSLGQRMDEYKRIKRGLAKVVVGTRSAVFAPFDNLGLIIVDEEGERSYKSDSSPRYHAIDVAKKRCRTHNAVLLLASATPSIESYYYAQKGIYELLEMKNRYSGFNLPKVEIVDMNDERNEGNSSEFSNVLIDEINNNLKNKEQTILLLNRRGYHTIISCCDCHKPVYCPNCSVPMTYHKVNDLLMCHYCGHSQKMPDTCAECGSSRLKEMGFGTQKLEEQLEKLFPQARILRMDADTTMSRYSYEKNFRDFGNGKYDIMVGTQMIGKGLDFPNVTLVGILSIDKALYAGDFRSYERTFSLVAQVVGRCGRGSKNGRAYLQTFMPDHYVLNIAASQDYKAFYNEEFSIRKALLFPPICDICVIGISNEDEVNAAKLSVEINEIIKKYVALGLKFPLRVLGPVRCSYGKINNKYRYRLILKSKNTIDFRNFIRAVIADAVKLKEYKDSVVFADLNGDIGV